MGNKKKQTKKKVNLDKEYNLAVKRYCKRWFYNASSRANNTVGEELIGIVIDDLKEMYSRSYGEHVFSLMEEDDVIAILNYSYELILGFENIDIVLKNAVDILSSKFSEQNLAWNPLMVVNRLIGKYQRQKGIMMQFNSDAVNCVAGIVTMLALYSILQNESIKNRPIKQFVEESGRYVIKYESLNHYAVDMMKEYVKISEAFYIDVLTKSNEALMLKTFRGKRDYDWNMVFVGKEYTNIPFSKEDEKGYISIDEIKKMPNDKLYNFPEQGICFEFLDKTANLDKIEIVETDDSFLCEVSVINNGGILVGNFDDETKDKLISKSYVKNKEDIKNTMEKYSEKILVLTLKIPKELIFNFKSYDHLEKHSLAQGIRCFLGEGKVCYDFKNAINHCIMSCVYIAYYCPNRYSDVLSLTVIKRSIASNEKKKAYRQSYMRKLPKGYSHSKDAEMLARESGYLSIPKGYTFVSESNRDLKVDEKMKIIKIRN